MFDRDSDPVLEESGEALDHGLAALWRRHLTEGITEDGRDSLTAFHLRVLPAGPHHYLPRGPQLTETSRRLRAWATSPSHFALLASFTPEEVYRRAAADPSFPPHPPAMDPPNTVPSPCGNWRVQWWITSSMADSYSSIEVVAMMVEDRRTGRNVAIPREFEDTSLRPVRFLSPRRVLLYSTHENAYFEARFDTAKTTKLARPEDAVDEYKPLVLTSTPAPRALILGLLSPCVFLSFLGAIAMAKGSRYLGALAIFLLSLAFASLAAWLCTDRRFQRFDPARGVILHDVRSLFHHAETQFLVEEFERIEVKDIYYKGGTYKEAALTGKRRLVLLNAHRAPEIAARLNLPVTAYQK